MAGLHVAAGGRPAGSWQAGIWTAASLQGLGSLHVRRYILPVAAELACRELRPVASAERSHGWPVQLRTWPPPSAGGLTEALFGCCVWPPALLLGPWGLAAALAGA